MNPSFNIPNSHVDPLFLSSVRNDSNVSPSRCTTLLKLNLSMITFLIGLQYSLNFFTTKLNFFLSSASAHVKLLNISRPSSPIRFINRAIFLLSGASSKSATPKDVSKLCYHLRQVTFTFPFILSVVGLFTPSIFCVLRESLLWAV
jgi:hypothetical protein